MQNSTLVEVCKFLFYSAHNQTAQSLVKSLPYCLNLFYPFRAVNNK